MPGLQLTQLSQLSLPTHTLRDALRDALRVVNAVVRAWKQSASNQAVLRELSSMQDHELRDLGLTRADIPSLARPMVLGDDWRSWHSL